jgi:hypothetical protein
MSTKLLATIAKSLQGLGKLLLGLVGQNVPALESSRLPLRVLEIPLHALQDIGAHGLRLITELQCTSELMFVSAPGPERFQM